MAWDDLREAEEALQRKLPDVDHDGQLSQFDQQAEQLRGRADEMEQRASEAVDELGPSPAAQVAHMHAGRLRAQADDHDASAAELLQKRLGPEYRQVKDLREEHDEIAGKIQGVRAMLAQEIEGLV